MSKPIPPAAAAQEEPERYAPTFPTLRELFLKSGNQCMFAGCHAPMVDERGNFIGQVCHIEGVKPKAARYRADQTNEERRHISNLMLMCYADHVKTNDEEVFTVKVLRGMKAAHEGRFTDLERKMQASVVYDITTLTKATLPGTLDKLHAVLGGNPTPDETAGDLAALGEYVAALNRVPAATRQVFCVLAQRGKGNGWVPWEEMKAVLEIGGYRLKSHFDMLERQRLLEMRDDEYGRKEFRPRAHHSGWEIAEMLYQFSDKTGIPLTVFVVDGNYAPLG